jgi:F-type H+-transporting ATPase subunit epsilon
VVISGGYAQIDEKGVIILADHARLVDDIEPDVVRETRRRRSTRKERSR